MTMKIFRKSPALLRKVDDDEKDDSKHVENVHHYRARTISKRRTVPDNGSSIKIYRGLIFASSVYGI